MYFKTLNMCWNHWVLKNYPLKTFWTVTMDIDSACQTKPLLIGSHHVYSKTNFFQVLLPNWNTLLQPSSLFITTPKLIACNTSSKKASQGRKQKTATQRELKALSNPAAQILLYWSCSFFGQYWSLAETCFYFTVLLNMEGSWTNRALLLFNDPVTRKVSTPERNYFKYFVYV